MRRNVLALIMAGLLAIGGLTGCGKSNSDGANGVEAKAGYASDAKLKIWGSQEDQEMYRELIEKFKQDNPEAKDWQIEFGSVAGADAKAEILKDPSAAADVFDFASDQVMELKNANVLYRITKDKDTIIKNNLSNAIQAATIDGELYGYPVATTTFVMFYDKSMYTEEEVKNLNTMMAKQLPDGVTNFSMDIDNGWFNSCFFQGVGCRLFGEDGQDSSTCDFNNEKGVMAGNYLADLATNPKFQNHDGPLLLKAFENRKLGATFQGTWDATDIKKYLGDDYGVATLPTITLENGETVQLASMINFNMTGVNAQTKYPAEAMLLAEYMTNNADALRYRFGERPGSPTNLEVAKEILENSDDEAMKALTAQAELSVMQTSIPQVGNFWGSAEAFGKGLMDGTVNKDNMQEKLDLLVKNTLAKLGE